MLWSRRGIKSLRRKSCVGVSAGFEQERRYRKVYKSKVSNISRSHQKKKVTKRERTSQTRVIEGDTKTDNVGKERKVILIVNHVRGLPAASRVRLPGVLFPDSLKSSFLGRSAKPIPASSLLLVDNGSLALLRVMYPGPAFFLVSRWKRRLGRQISDGE